jgi:hypothetical protein
MGEPEDAQIYSAKLWSELLNLLHSLGSAREVAPGRIHLKLQATGRDLEIVMTPEEWADMVSIVWGDVRDALSDVRLTALSVADGVRFLVYGDYRLEPSLTDALLPDPEDARLERGTDLGSWVVLDDKGLVVDRFADHSDL